MAKTTTVIDSGRNLGLDWREFLKNRELLYFFTWRNFKIRYKQTLIGAGWAVFRPFALMVVFTAIFQRTGNLAPGYEDIPYPLFLYSGLLFWTYFAQTTTQVGESLLTSQNIIKKIYFPRLIAPVSVAITGLIDFFFSFIIYIGLMAYYGVAPGLLGVLMFLPMVLMSFLAVMGVGSFMTALNVRYRDVRQALPFAIQLLLFLTPVIYSVDFIPQNLQWILFVNPMAGVVEAMRAGILGVEAINWGFLGISVLSLLVILIIGLAFFRSQERKVADLI
ncbi:MAG: ABC transporter permease [Candidatus Saccharimonadales bacterium]|nr:ABC transporter permease [Candidatus Saccharimonadales bacterium]